jgi:hypothetical protein
MMCSTTSRPGCQDRRAARSGEGETGPRASGGSQKSRRGGGHSALVGAATGAYISIHLSCGGGAAAGFTCIA